MKIPQDMVVGSIHSVNDGNLVIKEYRSAKDIDVEFISTGAIINTRAQNIRNKSVRDRLKPIVGGIGFMGIGKYKSSEKGRKTKAYVVWAHMMERCYLERVQSKQPTYIDCTVHPEWHNFQNFADWYYKNYPNDGNSYDLDKDIKIDGNKVYGPNTCLLVSHKENTEKSRAKTYVMKSPEGEIITIYNMRKFCADKGLCGSKMIAVSRGRRNYHKGWTKAYETS